MPLPSPATAAVISASDSCEKCQATGRSKPEDRCRRTEPAVHRLGQRRTAVTAWLTPLTMKNTVISKPAFVKLSEKVTHQPRKQRRGIRWKKCEVPCASPTRPMISASCRSDIAGAGALIGVLGSCGAKQSDDFIRRPVDCSAESWLVQRRCF